jgi:hypothetical protein
MLEITGDDVALLNQEDLRTLVGRLCEAEVRKRALPLSTITWGGDQNAVDGGLDVRVRLRPDVAVDGFIPRPNTGFQVKRSDMQPNSIVHEMCPHGRLRPVIEELTASSGAYVIVSSRGSASDSALKRRYAAMNRAVAKLPNRDSLFLDFYDRNRIATWVRQHAGLVLWVRERIGKPLTAWRSYGAWAFSPDGIGDEYLLDNAIRIGTGKVEEPDGITAAQGLTRIREVLRSPRGIVRLVGLSGVGKTRFVQALFDDRVGEQNLPSSQVLYVNVADDPDPQPLTLASELCQSGATGVLVIDNCQPELHRRLSELCRTPQSCLSLITVEYDIREDQPEGTEVFDLQPSSSDLIERLLARRFPLLSRVDAHTISAVHRSG